MTTPPPPTTLAEFVLGCLAADEAVALAATPGPWMPELEDGDVWGPGNRERICQTSAYAYGPDAAHIAQQDPAATLARIKAVRAVVELWLEAEARLKAGTSPAAAARAGALEAAVRVLAQMFAGRDGFREEWAA